jgi:hypothetical protein
MSRFLLPLALLLAAVVPSAAQSKRVALVIGISDYQHLSSLINPVPDAKAIAAELRDPGSSGDRGLTAQGEARKGGRRARSRSTRSRCPRRSPSANTK